MHLPYHRALHNFTNGSVRPYVIDQGHFVYFYSFTLGREHQRRIQGSSVLIFWYIHSINFEDEITGSKINWDFYEEFIFCQKWVIIILIFQDHNYGAQRPPTPPQSPPPAPVVIPLPEIEIPLPRPVGVPSLDVNGTTEESITRCICQFQHDDGYMICCDKCRYDLDVFNASEISMYSMHLRSHIYSMQVRFRCIQCRWDLDVYIHCLG